MSQGQLFILSGPSGSGKSTLMAQVLHRLPNLAFSVSHTTRAARANEQDGAHYHFIDKTTFLALRDNNPSGFLEWAEVHGNFYGTPRGPVEHALAAGKDVLFDIDWQGAKQVADAAPADSVRVFILPPSWEDLSRRLHARAQDSEEVIQKRLVKGKDEIEHWRLYDYVIVNKNFDRAYADLGHIYRSERMKPGRNPWLPGFVEGLLAE